MTSEDEGRAAQTQSGDGESHPPPPPPPALNGDGVEKPNNGQNHGGERSHKGRWFPKHIKPAEWIMIAFTAVTALAAWAGVWVANGQLQALLDSSSQTDRAIAETHRLADLARDANAGAQSTAADQRRETNIAIGIAKGQLATAQSTANKQLRAYIWAIATPIENFEVNQIPRWGIQYGAIGQTPAYNVGIHLVVTIMGYPSTPDLKTFYSAKVKSEDFQTVVFPGNTGGSSTVELVCPVPRQLKMVRCALDESSFAKLKDASGVRIYALGFIVYQDAFGTPHRTPFCFDYNPNKIFGVLNETCPKTPKPN